jgi:hypothetical protein
LNQNIPHAAVVVVPKIAQVDEAAVKSHPLKMPVGMIAVVNICVIAEDAGSMEQPFISTNPWYKTIPCPVCENLNTHPLKVWCSDSGVVFPKLIRAPLDAPLTLNLQSVNRDLIPAVPLEKVIEPAASKSNPWKSPAVVIEEPAPVELIFAPRR